MASKYNKEDDYIVDSIISHIIEFIADQIAEQIPISLRTGQPGGIYIQELLDSNNNTRIHEILRMKKGIFIALRNWLIINTKIK
jgi:hypothetical protein